MMDLREAAVFLPACGLLAAYLRWQFGSWRQAGLLLLLCLPPLYLALERTGQFMTVDEAVVSAELLKPDARPMTEQLLQACAMRTSLLLACPARACADAADPESVRSLQAWLKLALWSVGYVVVLWTVHLVRAVQAECRSAPVFLLLFWSLLLLPVTEMGLKTFNYDLLSMLLGVVAVLLLVQAVRRGRPRAALAAVLVSYLAAQEKLLASPILLVAVSYFAHVRQLQRPRPRLLALAADVGLAVLSALALGLGFVVTIRWSVGLPRMPRSMLFREALEPFLTWTWGLLRFSLGVNDFAEYFVLSLALSGAACLAGALLLSALARRAAAQALVGKLKRLAPAALLVVLAAAVVTGAVANRVVQPYWAPYRPVSPGRYEPPGEINGSRLHFDAATATGHELCSVGYAYAVFLNAVPTVCWGLAGLLLLCRPGWRALRETLDWPLLLLACLLVPLAFGVLQINVAHRYLNLFLALFVVVLVCLAGRLAAGARPAVCWALAAAFAAGLLGEVAPFRPFYAAFRPFWVEYPSPHSPVAGAINPSWVGWGEETMLAGERLLRLARRGRLEGVTAERPARLYSIYYGLWLRAVPGVRQVTGVPAMRGEEALGYGERDYYLINRTAAVTCGGLPPGVRPAFTISFRGFDQAWVYQGKSLYDAGLVFDPGRIRFLPRGVARGGPAHLAAARR
jgi:hypothetical protein